MLNSQLFKILRTFSKEEMKEFEKLVASPFFSTGRNLIQYYKSVKKFYPNFNDEKLNEKFIFNSLYPGKLFSKDIINKLTTDLMTLSIEYLKQLSLKRNPVITYSNVSLEAKERNLDFLAVKLINHADSLVDKNKIDANYYSRMETIIDVKQKLQYNSKTETEINNVVCNIIIKKFMYLGSSYKINSYVLNLRSKKLNYKNFLTLFLDSTDIEYILEHYDFKNTPEDKFLLINIYSILCYKFLDKDVYFDKLKETIFSSRDFLEIKFLNNYIMILKNAATLKVNIFNQHKYNKEIFEIIKFSLKNKTYINPILNCFPKIEFLSYFLSGFNLGKYKWSDKFLNDFKNELKSDEREDAFYYCKSLLTFINKDFDNTLIYLNKIDTKDDFEKALVYYVKSAVYFEQGFIEESKDLLNTYSKFIKRIDNVERYRLTSYSNFIRCIRLLIRYKETNDWEYLHDLKILLEKINYKTQLISWFKSYVESKM